MALKPKAQANNNKAFVQQPEMEAGTYPARLVQILDLGLQPARKFVGKPEGKPTNRIMLTYEFVDSFMVDEEGNELEDKPRWFSEEVNWYGIWEGARGTGAERYAAFDPDGAYEGDLASCIEAPVMVTITINRKGEKVYVNIDNVAAMRKRDAEKCPELKNPPKIFDTEEPNMEIFNKLPEWLREKIKGNLNYAGSALEKAIAQGGSDEKAKPVEEDKKATPKRPKQEDPDLEGDEEDETTPW